MTHATRDKNAALLKVAAAVQEASEHPPAARVTKSNSKLLAEGLHRQYVATIQFIHRESKAKVSTNPKTTSVRCKAL